MAKGKRLMVGTVATRVIRVQRFLIGLFDFLLGALCALVVSRRRRHAPMNQSILKISGEGIESRELSAFDLAAVPAEFQIADVSQIDPKRKGTAVRLEGVLQAVRAMPEARYLTLHAAADDFHASVPLADVRERGLLIYQLDGRPLPLSAGGPVRFYIPDFAACHSHEIDECANVKFVDHIELTRDRGFDNRPRDEQQHAALHKGEEKK